MPRLEIIQQPQKETGYRLNRGDLFIVGEECYIAIKHKPFQCRLQSLSNGNTWSETIVESGTLVSRAIDIWFGKAGFENIRYIPGDKARITKEQIW